MIGSGTDIPLSAFSPSETDSTPVLQGTLLPRIQGKRGTHLQFIPKLGSQKERTTTPLPFSALESPTAGTVSTPPHLALPPAFRPRKEDTSPQTQTGTDGHFVMQMRAPAQRTKLQPRGKGAGPFPADKSKKGGALKMTLPLPHPQPALRRKSNRPQGPGSGFLPNN